VPVLCLTTTLFFGQTNGFLDLFTREEIEGYLTNITNTTTPANGGPGREYTIAALDVIIAIGGQCRAQSTYDLLYAVRCFSRAQKVATASALEDPCLDMVRCFLLMAFYMLGACRRNAAFMYLGIASQASSALGLHVTEQYRHFRVPERSIRYVSFYASHSNAMPCHHCSCMGWAHPKFVFCCTTGCAR
jgi:hypothetical protein